MTCKDCIHYDVCCIVETSADDKDYYTEFGCVDFRNKDNFVEVVRCCDCIRKSVITDSYNNARLFCNHSIDICEVAPTDYCSFGERKEKK